MSDCMLFCLHLCSTIWSTLSRPRAPNCQHTEELSKGILQVPEEDGQYNLANRFSKCICPCFSIYFWNDTQHSAAVEKSVCNIFRHNFLPAFSNSYPNVDEPICHRTSLSWKPELQFRTSVLTQTCNKTKGRPSQHRGRISMRWTFTYHEYWGMTIFARGWGSTYSNSEEKDRGAHIKLLCRTDPLPVNPLLRCMVLQPMPLYPL